MVVVWPTASGSGLALAHQTTLRTKIGGSVHYSFMILFKFDCIFYDIIFILLYYATYYILKIFHLQIFFILFYFIFILFKFNRYLLYQTGGVFHFTDISYILFSRFFIQFNLIFLIILIYYLYQVLRTS